jgi:hypothetical protein
MNRKVDRLLEYLEFKGITENRATVECNLSQGLIYQAKSGKADLGNKAIEKILSTYRDLDKVWLLTGEGNMLIGEKNQPEIPAEEKPMVSNSLLEYLQRKVEQLERENAELLQENAVLRYENMMLTPRKGDAEDVASSLSADAI